MTEQALRALLSDMSIAEKAGQLAQIPMTACLDGVSEPTGPMQAFQLTPEQLCLCGSVIGDRVLEAPEVAQVVLELQEQQPHHIPVLVMKDVIHGHRTMFPIPLALGASFDEQVAESAAACAAEEAAACGAHVTFAPMVDVVRDPRWGRVMESPGEAPLLCSRMGAAMVKGTLPHLAACVKHFAGYGLSQAGQEYAPIDVSHTELYNTYLPPFQAAVDAGAQLIMPCFDAIDRVPCVANKWLLKDVLRDRMGFEGVSISDWGDPGQLLAHGVAADLAEAAQLCLEAGLDMDMMSFAYLRHLPELVESGQVSGQLLDEACWRVLRLKNQLGLFELPVRNDDPQVQASVCGSERIRQAAFQAAAGSCVLLKNDQALLPLKNGVKVALAGPLADSPALLGGWTLDADKAATPTLLQRFRTEERVELVAPGQADVILYAGGERQEETGEAASKAFPVFPPEQLTELRALHSLGKPVVLLLFCGRPLVLTEALPLCSAVLNCWFPGSEGAEAVRALVMGDENPSGHLSMTFPRSVGQIPIHHDRLSTCRPHQPGVWYCNGYLDEANEPLFPFGWGLSYTTFEIEKVEAAAGEVTATVRNTGDRGGSVAVQLYARLRHGALIRPDKRLISWEKITLRPYEATTVHFPLTAQDLAAYDAQGETLLPHGLCDFSVAFHSAADWNASANLDRFF